MKLKEVVLKCIGCKRKETLTEMPTEQPICKECGMPMIVDKVKAGSK